MIYFLIGAVIGLIYSLIKWNFEKKTGIRFRKKDPLGICAIVLGIIYGFFDSD